MPGLGGYACRLEPRDAAADDDHVPRVRRVRGWSQLESRLGILDACDRELREPPRDADVQADALADLVVLSCSRFPDELGIRDLRSCHPDQVAASVCERSLAHFGSRDASLGDDDGVGYGLLDGPCERNSEPGLVVERRHQEVEAVVVAVPDAEVVDIAALGQVRDRLDVARHRRGHGDAEQGLVTDRGAQRVENRARQPHPVVERTAVFVRAPVAGLGHEPVDERVVREHALDSVDAGGERRAGGSDVTFYELLDVALVELVHRTRPAAWRRSSRDAPELAHRRDGVRIRTEVVELGHEHGSVGVHRLDRLLQGGHEALVVETVVLRRHSCRREHWQGLHDDQPRAPGRPGFVVRARSRARDAVLGEGRSVRGEDDAIAELVPAQRKRREQPRKRRWR